MKVLMVSTEYPPMKGGVGRYTSKLVEALRKTGDEIVVEVACNQDGQGEFAGISPTNERNSDVLLKIVEEESRPDIVHVQFEPGLYGLIHDSANPSVSYTYIDEFYRECKVPIVTTFHSVYTLREWIGQSMAVKHHGRLGKFGIPLRVAVRTWKSIIAYGPFLRINKEKLKLSSAGICFSNYMSRLLGGGNIVYHGADPALFPPLSKVKARANFGLPTDKMIAVAVGFGTATKGWDILSKMEMPDRWVLVLNSSRSHFNKEQNMSNGVDKVNRLKQSTNNSNTNKVIDLQMGFLSEEELSILFYASDIVVLPYKITSGSGVMFDALAHALPFVASNLDFFKEFEAMGLGITARRDPSSFAKAIEIIGKNYNSYLEAISNFAPKLRWEYIAKQHIEIYDRAIMQKRQTTTFQSK
ncbi:MAG: glycosyltransferase family 4 protein [Thermoproteota archaeon]|nr:glycosyltransferase family 4 protein [Thermoproteota archaeon]